MADTKSSIVDVVTEADREVERLIRNRLADARPDDGILGEEEGGAQTGTSGLTWVVDPIDGTTNYLYGIPHYAVSIALVEGEPDPLSWRDVVGVVFNPASGELYSAAVGEGAHLGGSRQARPASRTWPRPCRSPRRSSAPDSRTHPRCGGSRARS